MSEENEIQDGIDEEIATATKSILAISSVLIGIVLGAVIGFYGTFYFCVMMDGGASQGGFVGAGWAFLFFTIPIGMLFGGGLGFFLPLYILRKKK
ncbi:hypothetical protein [uncultured Gimesia sp.]|uniref:hypothetical protein n=1 Tax=uncultured Gimesia sp. TaxID=1678688 RepID=UPI00260E2456|nr:hypothetical protein [uncultured Gimesia sp.]